MITEVTFKVFPAPQSWLTLRIPCANATEAADRIAQAASSRWELDALEYLPGDGCLCARIGGPAEANTALAEEVQRAWLGATIVADSEAHALWSGLREFGWAHADGVLAKIPITLDVLASVADAVGKTLGARAHFSAAGNVAYVSLPSPDVVATFIAELQGLGLSGIVLSGGSASVQIGIAHEPSIVESVRAIFDPDGRFAPLA